MPIDELIPQKPTTLEDTGLDFGFLADLALKMVYADTHCTTERVSQRLKVPMNVAETLLQFLYHEKLLDIRGQTGFQNHQYAMLDRGWERVRRILEINGYIGPAPVTLADYTARVRQQEQARELVERERFEQALGELVLPRKVVQTLYLVVRSRRSLFMSGPAGNGKTSIARALHTAVGGEIWIPYAIEIDGQIIKVFDMHNHEVVEAGDVGRYDERWIKIKRPRVIVGGELTIEEMDLIYSRTAHYYEAPFQIKSNGGTLVIDDFGRQRVEPRDLLNRWIIPLESHVDYLTLHTGKKIEVPFEQLLIFATNLNTKDLVDAAFLRRMGYRLQVDMPTADMYVSIFRQYADSHGFSIAPGLIDLLLERYRREERDLRGCEPHDLIERCIDIRSVSDLPPELTPDLIDLAWTSYFGTAV